MSRRVRSPSDADDLVQLILERALSKAPHAEIDNVAHWLECTEQFAPLIDPNVHNCGSVPPHGHRELTHPEVGYYAIGAKSYGRAPNFLMATGYEQARSVVAALAGDLAAADDVQLVLPETGVCSVDFAEPTVSSGCCEPASQKTESQACGGPSPQTKQTSNCCG